MKRNPFVGRWRITDMEQWDVEYRDVIVPAFIEFSQNGQGGFSSARWWGGWIVDSPRVMADRQ